VGRSWGGVGLCPMGANCALEVGKAVFGRALSVTKKRGLLNFSHEGGKFFQLKTKRTK